MGSEIFSIKVHVNELCSLFLKLMGNVSKMLFKVVDRLHCPEKYLCLCLETL